MKAPVTCLLALLAAMLAFGVSAEPLEAAAKKKEAPAKNPFDQPMRVVIVRNNAPGCEPLCPQWISAEGQITTKTPSQFKKVFARAKDLRLPVVITSTGGDVDAALAIGEMIRARRLDVGVGWTHFAGCAPDRKDCKLPKQQKNIYRGIAVSGRAFCVSACTFILAGGERRLRGEGTLVGVHQISRTITQERVRYLERYRIVNGKRQVLSRKIVSRKPMKSYVSTKLDKKLEKKLAAYFKKMGVDKSLLALFERAPPTSMYMLAGDETRTTRLITDVAPVLDLVVSSLCDTSPPAGNCVALEGADQATVKP